MKMDPDVLKYSTLKTVVEKDILGKIKPVDIDEHYELQLADDLPDGNTVVNRRIVNCEDGSAVTVQEYFKRKSPQQKGELKSDDGDYFTAAQIGDELRYGGAKRSNIDKPLFKGRPLCENPKQYFCQKCGNSFNASGPLKSHIRTCLKKREPEKESEEQRTCGTCGKVLHSVAYLKEHMKRHSSGFGTLRCTQCYRRFKDEAKWKAHMEDHEKQQKLNAEADALSLEDGIKKVVKEFTCSFCSVKFKVVFDEGQTKRRFTCDDCITKYSNPEHLKQRMDTMKVPREFRCDGCGSKYVFQGFLQRHMQKCDVLIRRRRLLNGTM